MSRFLGHPDTCQCVGCEAIKDSDRLRAELAATEKALSDNRMLLMKATAELAAKDARIARYEDADTQMVAAWKAECETLRTRIAELEERSAMSWGGFNLFGDSKSIEEAKRLLHEAGRAEQLVELLKVERARALPDCEPVAGAGVCAAFEFARAALGKVGADLKRANAERDAIAEWIIMIENRLECAVQGDEICKGCIDVAYSYAKEARAALAPSPAGRGGTDCRLVLCEHCGSEGRLYSGHPNDPHPRDAGPCPICDGTGVRRS